MPSSAADPYFQHLMDANRAFCDQIRIADQKAAYIFTFVLALMVWSSETRKALNINHLMTASGPELLTSLILLASLVISLCAAICVVLPRSRPGTSVFYWGAWPNAGARLWEARAAEDASFIQDDLMQNTRTLATICQNKYRLVRLSFRSLLVVVFAYIALLIVSS